MSLAWLRQVIDREWPDDAPAKGSIVAVAAYFIKSGDPDGRNVFPAIDTMARDLRLSRHTVLGVTKAMQAEGMLERAGKIRTGTINYRLCLEPVEAENVSGSASDSVPSSVSSSAQRGTLPTTYDRKGVGGGGGGEGSPDGNTPAAVATGSETGDIKTITTAVMIHDDRANHIITDFITAFDARFAQLNRKDPQRLEPHNDKLRRAIITKTDAGWPQHHLIDRITADLPRNIHSITGLIASKIAALPDKPDATALAFILADDAATKLRQAAIDLRQSQENGKAADELRERRDRRNRAIREFERAVRRVGTPDVDEVVREMVASLDDEAQYCDDPEAWPLSEAWVECLGIETEILRDQIRALQAAKTVVAVR